MEGTGRSTMKVLLFLTLLGGIHSQAAYNIKDCGSGTIRFYEETQPTLKCTGMTQHHNIYWSVNDTEGNEVRIGDCNKTNTNTNTDTCYGVTDSDYELTRPAHNESVLKIKGNIRQKDGYTMECSQRNNARKAFCRLKIISYTIPICESGTITLREGEVTTLQCVGMHGLHSMYWSVYDEDGNEVRIGDCNTTRQCTSITSNDFNVTRPTDEMSELTIQGNYREKAGKTIKCSQLNDQTQAFCRLSVIYGPDTAILEIEKGTSRTMLVCRVDDVNPAATFTWTGVDCDSLSHVTNNTASVCVFEPTSDDDGKVVTCTATNVVDSSLTASDTYRIEHRAKEDSSELFPTTAIAGGVGAAVVIIVVVIVVIISRRKKRAAEENQVINEREEANEPERQMYDRLQPASLADNRHYTELTVSTVSNGFQSQDARQTYERLQPDLMADNRDYTALSVSDAARVQRSQDNMYYNADLESDQSAGPSYTNFEGATSTNGT